MRRGCVFQEVKRVFKDTVVYGLGSLLPKMAGIVLVPIYTRFLLPKDYGIISLATMITTMVSTVMMLGQNGSLTLYLRQLENKGQKEDGGKLVFTSVIFVMLVGFGITALLLVLGPTVTPYVVNQPEFTFNPYMRIALLTAFLALPFGLLQAVNRSRGQSGTHTSLQIASFVLNTGITIWFVVSLRQGAYGSLKGNFGAALLLFPITLYFLARNMKISFSIEWLKRSLVFGLPLIPHFFAGWMLTFSDRWILGHYRSLAEVGLYSLAYNLSMILNMAVMAVNTAWGPVYYDLAGTDDGRKKLPRLVTVYASAVTVFAMAYLLFSREALLILATPRYWSAAPLVPIIVAGYYAFALYVVVSTGIFYAGKTKYVPLISAVAAAVNIGLNLLLVPIYGMWAAAWMTLVAYTIMAVIARVIVGRLFPGSLEDARLVKLIAVFIAVFLANAGVNALGVSVPVSIALKLGILALSLGALLWLDVIAISEARALLDRVLSRRKGTRTVEQDRDLAAAEETVDGAMADDTGFQQGQS